MGIPTKSSRQRMRKQMMLFENTLIEACSGMYQIILMRMSGEQNARK